MWCFVCPYEFLNVLSIELAHPLHSVVVVLKLSPHNRCLQWQRTRRRQPPSKRTMASAKSKARLLQSGQCSFMWVVFDVFMFAVDLWLLDVLLAINFFALLRHHSDVFVLLYCCRRYPDSRSLLWLTCCVLRPVNSAVCVRLAHIAFDVSLLCVAFVWRVF